MQLLPVREINLQRSHTSWLGKALKGAQPGLVAVRFPPGPAGRDEAVRADGCGERKGISYHSHVAKQELNLYDDRNVFFSFAFHRTE